MLVRKEISVQISVPIRTSMSDNSQIHTTFHALLKGLEKIMSFTVHEFFRVFPRNFFLLGSFRSYLLIFFFSLLSMDFVDFLAIFCCVLTVFSVLLLLLLILSSHSFFLFLLLFHQRCSSTSPSYSTECFYVPWSWTDHLPRRNKRHRKQR